MSGSFEWPQPKWLENISDEKQRDRARVRFYVGLAALYHNEKGRFDVLDQAMGLRSGACKTERFSGYPGARFSISVEKAVGRDLFPRELFRPDLFVVEPE